MNLRDALLVALASVPGTRQFHVHVLLSSPRKNTGLYPYAHPRPRVFLQELLVVVSEQPTPDSPRVLVTAVEAYIYHIPATSCGILYVSKVDTTGQAAAPSPTAALVRALLLFYADPATRPLPVRHLWIQLFARAQGQYLFPNSADHPGKIPLTDVRLCVWWKRLLGDVATQIQTRATPDTLLRLYYVLPGYNELEAAQALHTTLKTAVAPDTLSWTYGHPYTQSDIPLPCPHSDALNLGHYIPWFEDDPKSRFLDEIAHTSEVGGVHSPHRKRSKKAPTKDNTHADTDDEEKKGKSEQKEKDSASKHASGELSTVSADEFWERMSFRQECVAGAVTGFFALGMSSPTHSSSASAPMSQPGQVAPRMVQRVVSSLMTAHEFSTTADAVHSTETFEASIRGLCGDLTPSSKPPSSVSSSVAERPRMRARSRTPERAPSPHEDPVPDVASTLSEPVVSLETYHSYIYGTVCVRNAPPAPKVSPVDVGGTGANGVPQVTVLTVRKKKRKAES